MNNQVSKHDQVLLALTMNLQGIAMVQLGKVSSPASGAIERDLDGARATIDILEMLKVKCRHETAQPVVRLLDQAVMDLQMNYLDELKRDRREREQEAGAAADTKTDAETGAEEDAAQGAEADVAPGAQADDAATARGDEATEKTAEKPGTSQT